MKPKFKVGDRVLCTDNGAYGNITLVDTSQVGEYDGVVLWYEVLFDNGEQTWLTEDILELSDVDKKTAFIAELKALLEKYDAEIRQSPNFGIVSIYIGNGDEEMKYTNEFITPSNIFDYD